MLAKRLVPFLLIAFLFTLFVASGSRVFAQTLFVDEDGQLFIMYPLGSVLGDEDKKEEEKKEEKKEEKREKKFEQTIEERIGNFRRKIEIRNGQYQEEVRDAVGKRKIKIEDGKLEIRIKPADEVDDEVENETGEGTPSAQVERVRVRQIEDVEIAPASGSGVEIRRGRIKARANFPLTIGADNELIVTTPAGSKVVTVLPDAAVANLMSRGIVSQVATFSGSPSQEVDLTAEGGKLEYKVRGVKDVKFLGLVPVSAPIEARVSAETGAVSSVSQPFYLNFFSFLFR